MRFILPIFPGIPICQHLGATLPFWPAVILSGLIMSFFAIIFLRALAPHISGHN